MSHIDILLPFGLPPAEFSNDLLKNLDTPALATLTARAKSGSGLRQETFEGFSRALPHETWLARQFGLSKAFEQDGSPPVAPALMHRFGLQANSGTWFIVQPVHIHIARDHLVLTDARHLMLQETEARALFDIAKPLFQEIGSDLLFGNTTTWFARFDNWSGLQTATPDAAAGHNIDLWMPKGPGERDWRKLQNEVQMHWHGNAINERREGGGLKPVNSLWLWGGGEAHQPFQKRYSCTYNLNGWMQAFAHYAECHETLKSADHLQSQPGEANLLVLDDLLEPALSSDWGSWLAAMQRLESDWFAPLLASLKSGGIDEVSLVITHDFRLSRFASTRSSLRKFWVKPSLAPLCP